MINSAVIKKSLITYAGGKFYLRKFLNDLILPHKTYVEVFGGAAHLLFYKNPSPVEVYNDIDERLVNFFNVLKNNVDLFYLKAIYLLCAREINFNYLLMKTDDNIYRAALFYLGARTYFNSLNFGNNTWCVPILKTRAVYNKQLLTNHLLNYSNRLLNVTIENKDFEDVINKYDNEDTFFYLDPPYLHNTRRAKKLYKFEMPIDDHIRLLNCLKNIKGKALLSGYDNELYNKYLVDWNKKEINTYCHMAGKTKNSRLEGKNVLSNSQEYNESTKHNYRKEIVWYNYDFNNCLINLKK